MGRGVAVYDACVLFSAPLRDLLLRLAAAGLCRAVWTEAIHEEWIRSVLATRSDLTREQLQRTRGLMDASAPDCLVVGYEPLIPTLSLPDADDRHVLAAAIHAGADAIVTYNVCDFPDATLHPFGIVAQHPDDFVAELCEQSPVDVRRAVREQRWALRNPPKTASELLEVFAKAGLTRTVDLLKAHVGEM